MQLLSGFQILCVTPRLSELQRLNQEHQELFRSMIKLLAVTEAICEVFLVLHTREPLNLYHDFAPTTVLNSYSQWPTALFYHVANYKTQ